MNEPQTTALSDTSDALAVAREVLEIEARAISDLIERLDQDFERAVALILNCKGRVVVSGIGKSGHIARKIASTMASTGTPAFFVHPAEASHGDLGMVTRDDLLIALSNSGESAELLAIVPLLKRQGAKLIALTGNPRSNLAHEADVHLYAGAEKEACPLNLAPTASTTAALALGDALAVALMQAKGFTRDEFARSHPGGTLGRRLLTHVRDVMRTGDNAPRIPHTATLMEGMLEMSRGRMGMTAVLDDDGRVIGIFTDGDLRRTLEKGHDLRTTPIVDAMTRGPRVIGPDKLAAEGVEIMERNKVNQLLVVDQDQRLLGALNMHDLFRAKVI
ncbi:MAG: KpsF/GutQ family sugar-phosphate isomerase [Betaproteobacteria bacterium]|nr:KpsF/GutQ family sugar-phosphate isomerase [Betaproteobacteria bacterium]